MLTGFICFRIGSNGMRLWTREKTLGIHKRGIFRISERLLSFSRRTRRGRFGRFSSNSRIDAGITKPFPYTVLHSNYDSFRPGRHCSVATGNDCQLEEKRRKTCRTYTTCTVNNDVAAASFWHRPQSSSPFGNWNSFLGRRAEITQSVSVGMTTGCGRNGRGSISDRGKIFFSTPQHPDGLWGPASLLYNGYRGLFPRG
jgi:Fe-S-cluster containining protein